MPGVMTVSVDQLELLPVAVNAAWQASGIYTSRLVTELEQLHVAAEDLSWFIQCDGTFVLLGEAIEQGIIGPSAVPGLLRALDY